MDQAERVTLREDQGLLVIELHGELDRTNLPQLRRAVGPLRVRDYACLAVDVSAVAFLDAAVLGLIEEILSLASDLGIAVGIVAPAGHWSRRLLRAAGIDRRARVYPTTALLRSELLCVTPDTP